MHFAAAGPKAHHRAPTVLKGPGWGQLGSTDQNSKASTSGGVIGNGALRRHGYNVLTWDPRGFGGLGGTAKIDSPRFEGRDVTAMISWVARQPEAMLDQQRDPCVGMVGGCYGGGIQLVAAGIDPRIDAIVPDIAWHSLATSLATNRTAKSGWGFPLYLAAVAAHARLDPHVTNSALAETASFLESPADVSFFASRGPGKLVNRIQGADAADPGLSKEAWSAPSAATSRRRRRATRSTCRSPRPSGDRWCWARRS